MKWTLCLLFGNNSSFGIFQSGKTLNCRQHESVWPVKWCCPAHLLFALIRFRKTSKLPLYHIYLVGFLRTHMPQCKGTFSDFCKSVQLLFMCLCVCTSVYLCYRTGQALCHIKYPSPVDLTTGGDDWNAISVPFQEHRKWEFWKCRNKIFCNFVKIVRKANQKLSQSTQRSSELCQVYRMWQNLTRHVVLFIESIWRYVIQIISNYSGC